MSEQDKQETRDIKPVVMPPAKEDNSYESVGDGAQDKAKSMGMLEKFIWGIVLVFSFVWIFIPEPTDAVPVLGWLDEGFAFMMVVTALDRFGIRIPFLEKMVWKGWGQKAGQTEKDITPPKD